MTRLSCAVYSILLSCAILNQYAWGHTTRRLKKHFRESISKPNLHLDLTYRTNDRFNHRRYRYNENEIAYYRRRELEALVDYDARRLLGDYSLLQDDIGQGSSRDLPHDVATRTRKRKLNANNKHETDSNKKPLSHMPDAQDTSDTYAKSHTSTGNLIERAESEQPSFPPGVSKNVGRDELEDVAVIRRSRYNETTANSTSTANELVTTSNGTTQAQWSEVTIPSVTSKNTVTVASGYYAQRTPNANRPNVGNTSMDESTNKSLATTGKTKHMESSDWRNKSKTTSEKSNDGNKNHIPQHAYKKKHIKERSKNKYKMRKNKRKEKKKKYIPGFHSCASARRYHELLILQNNGTEIKDLRKDLHNVIEELCQKEREIRTESVKRTILQRLHLDEPPPELSDAAKLPPHFLRYELPYGFERPVKRKHNEEDYDPLTAKTTRIYTVAEERTLLCKRPFTRCYNFTLNEATLSLDDIEYAEMWIYKYWHRESKYNHTYVLQSLKGFGRDRRLQPKQVIDQITGVIIEGWMKFNITRSVKRWIKKGKRNVGISVRCKSCRKHEDEPLWSIKKNYLPILAIGIGETKSRRRRSIESFDCFDGMRQCCREEFTVNFHEMGWNWIVYPTQIVINYCKGSCEDVVHSYYDHTQAVQSFRTVTFNQTLSSLLEPCCVPMRYSAVPIIIRKNVTSFVQTEIPNLRVEECGCV